MLYTELLKLVVPTLYFITNWKRLNVYYKKNMCPKSVLDNQIETFLDKTVYSRQRYNFWKTKNITLKLTIYQIFFSCNKKGIKTYLWLFCKDIDINIAHSL